MFEFFDNLIEKKDSEINDILEKKTVKKKDSTDNKDELSYDVKKILGKQKSHETKRNLKSKAYQNKEIEKMNDLMANC
tara:strand:+ start:8546 stop:8779 length:234 start_codon:yes stop_codon:yes gene_type:complete